MIQNLLTNWRTTSTGLLTILTALVNLGFAHKNGVDDQGTWILCLTQVVTGIGLMFSRDQAASRADRDQTVSDITTLQKTVKATADAAVSGDTEQLKRVVATIPTGQPTPTP